MSKPKQPTYGATLLPLGIAVALMDDEAKQRIAFFIRELAAKRLGMSDVYAGLDLADLNEEQR